MIWQTVVFSGAMLGAGCPGGGGGTYCRPARPEEMPAARQWDVMPVETPGEASAEGFLVSVDSQPSGATVFMNGEEVGRTPVHLTVPAGDLHLRVESEGYAVAEQTFPVDQDLDARVTMITPEEAADDEVCEHRGRGFVLA